MLAKCKDKPKVQSMISRANAIVGYDLLEAPTAFPVTAHPSPVAKRIAGDSQVSRDVGFGKGTRPLPVFARGTLDRSGPPWSFVSWHVRRSSA